MSDTYTPTSQPDLAGKAKDMVRDVKAKASELSGEISRAAKNNVSELGDAALKLADNAKDKVEAAVVQQKSVGADFIESIAQATGRAAQEFESDLPSAAHYIRQASDQIHSVANTVRERDVRELVGEVQEFARQQPTLFFGGAVILGFAALRFLKSTTPQKGNSPHMESSAFDARRGG